MNTDIAPKRFKEVLRVDVITNRKSDFLASHVPFKNLHLAKKLTAQAKLSDEDQKKYFSEEEIYSLIAEPVLDDRFTLVTGTNGAGKSHLIRWLANMMRIREDESEVVLFIKRNDNTLKGTIRQLLEIPEVQNIHDKDRYKRLANASRTVSESQLKDLLYYNYIVHIEADLKNPDEMNIKLARTEKKRLIALLQNALFKEHAMREDGPVERIYAKVAGTDFIQSSDATAQFNPEDFYISTGFYDAMHAAQADGMAERMARFLLHEQFSMQDNGRVEEEAGKLARYMNWFTDDVIQDCAGLQAGDMQQIFSDIRKELHRQGKNLTILVEDITSFTGVNSALLQALMTPHTGEYASENLCRVNAIVGSTDGYYNDNFRDNFKERITQFVWVPGNIFEQDYNRLYEFFARYLNTMSLDRDTVDYWAQTGANPESYPVHTENIGQYWDTYSLNGHDVSLYPFSKHAIQFLYNNCDPDKRTPRRIMQDIILPYVEEILQSTKKFPSREINLRAKEIKLRNKTRALWNDPQYSRLLRFMTVWGNGTNDQEEKNGITYVGGIAQSIYKDLGLPDIKGEVAAAPENKSETPDTRLDNETDVNDETDGKQIISKPLDDANEDTKISSKQRERLKRAEEELSKWVNNSSYTLDVTATTKGARDFNEARKNINNFLYNVIDWGAEGVPADALTKISTAKERFFVSLERQGQRSKNSAIELPANNETSVLIEAFLKWSILGNQSWDYPDSYGDLLIVQIWLEKVKPQLVRAIMEENGKPINYFSYAASIEAYRQLFNDIQLNPKSLNFKAMMQGAGIKKDTNSMGHVREWKVFCQKLNNKEGDSFRDTFLQYYNLPQGNATSSNIYILDRLELDHSLKKTSKNNLIFPDTELQLDDPIVHRRKISENLKDIQTKAALVVSKEKESLKTTMDGLSVFLDLDEMDADDVRDLVKDIKDFYGQTELNHVSVKLYKSSQEISDINKSAPQISKSLKVGQEVLGSSDDISSLVKLTYDPLKYLDPLLKLLNKVSVDIDNANDIVSRRMIQAAGTSTEQGKAYSEERKVLSDCEAYLGGDD